MSATSTTPRASAASLSGSRLPARGGGSLQGRVGGPVGVHAVRSGIWFDAGPWAALAALLTWLLCLAHQKPCQQTEYGKPVNAMLRLCYSDVPILYQQQLGTGLRPYRDFALDYGPVTGAVIVGTRWITRLLGYPAVPTVSGQDSLHASYVFFLVTAVILFACFAATVAAHLLLGRSSATSGEQVHHRSRSWDALYVAGAPVVAAAGLVNWDLLAVALTALALLLWASEKPVAAGVLFGLAVGSKFYPVVIVAGIVLLCARAGRLGAANRLVAGTLGAWLLTNLPLIVLYPKAWATWYSGWAKGSADLGSVWFLLAQLHLTVPRPGLVGLLAFLVGFGFVVERVLRAPRRPRVGQVAFLLVALLVLTGRGYPPQHVLWLLPLLVLARPVLFDWALFCGVELLYFWAVWGHLNGSLLTQGSIDGWYLLAITLHAAMLVWLIVMVVRDMSSPWDDPVRLPFVDDPVGGPLDHSPDAGSPGGELAVGPGSTVAPPA